MRCRSVRQILARSSDLPALLKNEKLRAHLECCPECRRQEFFQKQVADVHELIFPYEVSPNFNYRLDVKLANSPKPSPLRITPGVRHRIGFYFAMGATGALALLVLFIVNRPVQVPQHLAVVGPPPAQIAQPKPHKLPIPLFTESAQASERPQIRLKPESPIGAQFASAASEPVRAGVDGESPEGWQESWMWVGDSESGYFIPVRSYHQNVTSSEPVLLLPGSSPDQNVNIVY